jgi:hypothetical protein
MSRCPDSIKGIKVNISPLKISFITRNLGSEILRFREGPKLEGLDLIVKSKLQLKSFKGIYRVYIPERGSYRYGYYISGKDGSQEGILGAERSWF